MLDYDGKKKAEHMCSAVTTMGALRAGGRYSQASGREVSPCYVTGTIQLEDRERKKKGTLSVTGCDIV